MDIDWADDAAVAEATARLDAEDRATRERLAAPEALAAAAIWYAGRGIAVFPLKPGTKHPATRHGLLDASTDVEWVTEWWRRSPDCNIGTPTGHRFDVIDVDPPEGWTSLADMRAAGAVPDTIGYAVTPRGGAHLYIAPTGDPNAAGILPGIDYRGLGGYVVAPPSRNENGMWLWAQPLVLP